MSGRAEVDSRKSLAIFAPREHLWRWWRARHNVHQIQTERRRFTDDSLRAVRYADPIIYFALPDAPGVGSKTTLEQAAGPTLEQLKDAPFRRINPQPGHPGTQRAEHPFEWADLLAGDMNTIRRYAPPLLRHKTIVVESAQEEDLEDMKRRGASIVVTLMPSLEEKGSLGRWSPAVIEGVLVAARSDPSLPLNEDTYLDLMAGLDWAPHIRYLQPDEAGINKFAFVIHPLDVSFIHNHAKNGPDAPATMPAQPITRLRNSFSSSRRSRSAASICSTRFSMMATLKFCALTASRSRPWPPPMRSMSSFRSSRSCAMSARTVSANRPCLRTGRACELAASANWPRPRTRTVRRRPRCNQVQAGSNPAYVLV